ncbi:synaptonemal complex protein 1-like isoform X2 [Limulus polyphemus]|nr:synaptonemal complex protein 1-like isoform X2 [Limulus polyphemus]
MAKKEMELKDLQRSYETCQHQIFQLSTQIIQKDGDLADMKKENSQLQIHINTLLEEVESIKNSQLELQNELKTMYKLLEEERNEYSVKKEHLQKEVYQLNEQLDMVHQAHMNQLTLLKQEKETSSSDQFHIQEALRQEVLKLREELITQSRQSPGLEKLTAQLMEIVSSFRQHLEESKTVTPDLSALLTKQVAQNERERLEIIYQQQFRSPENIWQNKMDEECQNISKEFMQKMKELEFDLKQKFEKEKSDIEQNYKIEISEIEKDLKHQFETEKDKDRKKIENTYQHQIEILRQSHADEKQALKILHYDELQASQKQQITDLESLRKHLNDYHQENISSLTKTLETNFHYEKDILQKNHEENIRGVQEDFEKKLRFECHIMNISHQDELNQLKESLTSKFQNDVSDLQKAHHEQFQRLTEGMRKHWEAEKYDLQKLHAEEIEAIKENLNRQFEHEKQIMKKVHIEETSKLKKNNEKTFENIINILKFCEEKSEHAASESVEYEKQSLNDIHNFELLKFQEECKSIISDKKQKLKQNCDEQLKQEREKLHDQFLEEHKSLEESFKAKSKEIEDTVNFEVKSVREQLSIKHQNSLHNLEEHLKTKWCVEKSRLEKMHQDEINHLEKCFQQQVEKIQHTMQENHQEELENLEKIYKQEVDSLQELLRKYKEKLQTPYKESNTGSSESLCNSEEEAPVSDFTSSSIDNKDSLIPPQLQKLLDKVYSEGTQDVANDRGKEIILQALFNVFGEQRKKLTQEMEKHFCYKDHIYDEVKKKIIELEKHQNVNLKELFDELMKEVEQTKLSLNKEKNQHKQAVHHLEQLNKNLKDENSHLEQKFRTEKELLEFQAKQEKAVGNDLRSSLEAEKLKNTEMITQLSEQRNECFELQMSLSSMEADLSHLKEVSIQNQKRMEDYLEAYQNEKTYSQALLKALETERVNVTQLQMAVESKKENKNSKESLISSGSEIVSLLSTSPDIEKFRSPDRNGSLDPDFNSTLQLQVTSLNETKPTETFTLQVCVRCSSLEMERASWVIKQSNLQKSLHQSENEVIRLKRLLQATEDENNGIALVDKESKFYKAYYKYRHAESYRRSLVYQKKYLLKLMGGYQTTEATTIAMLAKINEEPIGDHHIILSPLSLFRSLTYVIIALHRMLYLVNRWKKAVYVCPFNFIQPATEYVQQKGPPYSATQQNEVVIPKNHHLQKKQKQENLPRKIKASQEIILHNLTS